MAVSSSTTTHNNRKLSGSKRAFLFLTVYLSYFLAYLSSFLPIFLSSQNVAASVERKRESSHDTIRGGGTDSFQTQNFLVGLGVEKLHIL
nr:hypothetical protein CFP56_15957 [Quercus suber]